MDSIFAIAGAGRLHPLDAAALAQPFRIDRDRAHAALSLGGFFQALEKAFLQEVGRAIPPFSPDIRTRLVFCLEKHGACGHVVSISCEKKGASPVYCAVVALGRERAAALAMEYGILRRLKVWDVAGQLPEIYACVPLLSAAAAGVEMRVLFSAWMEDFHEWHLEKGPSGAEELLVWDKEKRNLDAAGRGELFFQEARILATFFDAATTARIFSWRHAAGDFIVRTAPGAGPCVRLVTVRAFLPMSDAGGSGKSRMEILLPFLLETLLLLRLDRLHGTGALIFLPAWLLPRAVAGFFAGLQENATMRLSADEVRECRQLLATFTADDFLQLYAALMPVFGLEEGEEGPLVKGVLEGHCQALAGCLRLPQG